MRKFSPFAMSLLTTMVVLLTTGLSNKSVW